MKNITPKGILMPIGGDEDREESKDVLCRMIEETGQKDPNICLITLATDVPDKVADVYKKASDDLKISALSIIHYNNRKEGDTADNLKKRKACGLVLFSGGKQLKLSTLLGGTKLMALITQRFYDEPKFVVAGTSAVAAAMSTTMIVAGRSEDAQRRGTL